ncbi:MAG: TIGR04283 family arsenosugar biosynthesis glycosyltransferase [Elusimicrobiota bacterium]
MQFSVIIPVWNEGRQLASALRRLRQISIYDNMELIVVDGGSSDDTREVAAKWADTVINHRQPNRGAQLHAGAQIAAGDLLFFLHADTQPPGNWQECLEQFWLSSHRVTPAATVFSVDYGAHWNYRLVAWGQNARVRWRQVAYGDAGFCTTREVYAACGGIPEIPLMEDVIFSERLRRHGAITLLPARIHPGARRLHETGPLRNSLRNLWIRSRFALGANAEDLWTAYYAKRPHQAAGLADGESALKAAVRSRRRKR